MIHPGGDRLESGTIDSVYGTESYWMVWSAEYTLRAQKGEIAVFDGAGQEVAHTG